MKLACEVVENCGDPKHNVLLLLVIEVEGGGAGIMPIHINYDFNQILFNQLSALQLLQ